MLPPAAECAPGPEAADWEADSPQLRSNLAQLLSGLRDSAPSRPVPEVALAKRWHGQMLFGLTMPAPGLAGAFRGEPGLQDVEVEVGDGFGVPADKVLPELDRFQTELRRRVATADARLPAATLPTPEQFLALLNLWAWAHAEWLRIHPFANGNGRIARLWVNWLAMRYGLPPFLRLRPRPGNAYNRAALDALRGEWEPTAAVLLDELRLLTESA